MIRERFDDGLCILTLDRPDRRNALTGAMLACMFWPEIMLPSARRQVMVTSDWAGFPYCVGM